MSNTHSQVITLTGTRQSGVTTSLLEHVKKSVESNPGKIAVVSTYNNSLRAQIHQLIAARFPELVGEVITLTNPTVADLRQLLGDGRSNVQYCGVFLDDGYTYLSHRKLMSLAREFPLLDIVVGDSVDERRSFPERGQTTEVLRVDDSPYVPTEEVIESDLKDTKTFEVTLGVNRLGNQDYDAVTETVFVKYPSPLTGNEFPEGRLMNAILNANLFDGVGERLFLKDNARDKDAPTLTALIDDDAVCTTRLSITDEQIKALALANGFKLKEQPNGTTDLNPYVYEFARELLASCQTVSVKQPKSIPQAFDSFSQAMKQDSEYAWSWLCNLAMLIKDASDDSVKHRHANVAAADFMLRAFDIDVTKFKEWADFERQWSNSGKPVKYLLNMSPTLSILLDNGMVKKVGKVNWDFYSLVGDHLIINDRSEFEIELELYAKILTEWFLRYGTRNIREE